MNKAGTAPKSPGVEVVDLGCPFCGAPAGQWCHLPNGAPRGDHKQREYRYIYSSEDAARPTGDKE